MNRTDYLAFHRECTARILAGNAPRELRYLVFTTQSFAVTPDGQVRRNIVGGFADRLKGVTTAFYLAVATGRYFMVDWTDPCPLENDLAPTPDGIDWRARFEGLPLEPSDVQPFNLIDDRYETCSATIASGDIESIWGQRRCVVLNINRIAPEIADNPRYRVDIASFLKGPATSQELFHRAYQLMFQYEPTAGAVRQA
jgi:hypothetical protein